MKSLKDLISESGAGLWGTDKARARLQKDTPGQPIKALVKSEDSPCWDSHKQVGMKKKGNKMVPNCVPKEEVSEMTHRFVFDKAVNLGKAEKLAQKFGLKTDSETQSNYYYLSVDDGGNTNNLMKWLKATDGLHEQVTDKGLKMVNKKGHVVYATRDKVKHFQDLGYKSAGYVDARKDTLSRSNQDPDKAFANVRRIARDIQNKKSGDTPTQYKEGSESWEAGYKRRVVKTTKPEHKEKGYNWRIKGKDKAHLTIKLYKDKPSQAEFNKQMKRVAGHEFGG